jgi:hypothetical protein
VSGGEIRKELVVGGPNATSPLTVTLAVTDTSYTTAEVSSGKVAELAVPATVIV